jgi:hypothetical protein
MSTVVIVEPVRPGVKVVPTGAPVVVPITTTEEPVVPVEIGTPGPIGPVGPVGPPGPDGPQGVQGVDGAQGIQGNQGPPGTSTIIIGTVPTVADLPPASSVNVGDGYIVSADNDLHTSDGTTWHNVGQIVGPPGPQGIQGVQGLQGIQGTTGATGSQGPTGATGGQGPVGPTGPQGAQGVWVQMTQAAYNALVTKDPNTLYVIVG